MATKPKPRKRSASLRARFTASWKNSAYQPSCSRRRLWRTAAAAANFALTLTATALAAVDEASPLPSSTIAIYGTADDRGSPIGMLQAGENAMPIAESQGTGGSKWFLIKSRSGVVGWIKQADGEQAKKVESFFKSLPPEPASTAVAIPSISSTTAPPGSIHIPVLSNGRSMIVSVTFNQSISANLMLDTGATNTVVSRRIAGLLSLRPIAKSVFHTVGGTVNVPVARIQSLKIGAAEITDVPIIIHDFSPDPRFEGLLGMDFLGRYKFGVDVKRQLLVLSPG